MRKNKGLVTILCAALILGGVGYMSNGFKDWNADNWRNRVITPQSSEVVDDTSDDETPVVDEDLITIQYRIVKEITWEEFYEGAEYSRVSGAMDCLKSEITIEDKSYNFALYTMDNNIGSKEDFTGFPAKYISGPIIGSASLQNLEADAVYYRPHKDFYIAIGDTIAAFNIYGFNGLPGGEYFANLAGIELGEYTTVKIIERVGGGGIV